MPGTLWNDLRYALRSLTLEPGFATVAILTLALGIGANTAIFSIVNTVLLRPLAYRDPGQLFVVRERVAALAHLYPTLPANASHYMAWRNRCPACADVAAFLTDDANLTGGGDPRRVNVARISANLFSTLGVQPQLGRNFLGTEDTPGNHRVAILSQALWRERYQSDAGMVGKTITLDGEPYVVVGILPESFRFPGKLRNDVYQPLALSARALASPGDFDYTAILRLKPGATIESASAELNAIESGMGAQQGSVLKAILTPLQETIVGPARRGLIVLLAAIASVLLIVCVNLANLLLARSSGRLRESSIRSALGASRATLVRLMLTESLLLGLIGGALGVALAVYSLQVFVRTAPVDIPRLDEIHVDANVLLFALGISMVTGLIFGILPALRLSSVDPQEALKSGSRSATESAKGLRLRDALVGIEVGLSAVLLIIAGLLIGSFYRLIHVNKGFGVERVLTINVGLPNAKYTSRTQQRGFYDQVLTKAQSTPGVTAAAFSTVLPLEGEHHVNGVVAEGVPDTSTQKPFANFRFVTPQFFQAFRIPVVRGRLFQEGDLDRAVAVISQRTADRLWPNQDPIGRRIRSGNPSRPPFEVVGVAGDIRGISLQQEPGLMIYMPFTMTFSPGVLGASLIVRTSNDPLSVAQSMRAAIAQVDPEVPTPVIRTMEQVLESSVAPRRFQMSLVFLFAATALVLASLGIYGVVSYSVTRRTNEIGIRMALGAKSRDVHSLILRQGLMPVMLGLAAAVAIALALGRTLSSLLFEVSPNDPVTIAGVVTLLTLVAAAACYIPARRATKTDPLNALRYE
jgi:predicted permease